MITGAARRNTEVSLLVISLVIAVGGYDLALTPNFARMAAESGLQAPVNRAIYAALKPYVDGSPVKAA